MRRAKFLAKVLDIARGRRFARLVRTARRDKVFLGEIPEPEACCRTFGFFFEGDACSLNCAAGSLGSILPFHAASSGFESRTAAQFRGPSNATGRRRRRTRYGSTPKSLSRDWNRVKTNSVLDSAERQQSQIAREGDLAVETGSLPVVNGMPSVCALPLNLERCGFPSFPFCSFTGGDQRSAFSVVVGFPFLRFLFRSFWLSLSRRPLRLL